MEIKAEQRYLLMSPRKIRLVVNLIKKLKPTVAVDTLPMIGKRAAEPVAKVIKQAIANAKEKGIDGANLVFQEIQVGEGPVLKRGRPVSRGRWHPIQKRMSHIRVILRTIKSDKPKKNGTKN